MKKKITSTSKKKNVEPTAPILFPKKLERANEILRKVGVPKQLKSTTKVA